VKRRNKNTAIIGITKLIWEFLLPLMHFALFIRRAAGEIGFTNWGSGGKNMREKGEFLRGKGKFLLGGNSQGWDSLNRPLAMVESFPFEKY
jgi:hypothetical protein